MLAQNFQLNLKLNMKLFRLFSLSLMALLVHISVSAQTGKYFTKTGRVTFSSKAPLETIQATNKSAVCVLDSKTGGLSFSVLMKGFEFEKALMQEHFNENYAESDKYPKSDFKGSITNNSAINYAADGVYPATVKGKLTLHGKANEIEATGKLTVKSGKITLSSEFQIKLSDYNITIPKVVKDNISQSVKIMVNCALEPLAK